MSASPNTDPFAGGESNPSLSFKGQPFGTTYEGVVAELPTMIHGRNFETGDLDYWDEAKTQPKMVVCTTLEINGTKWSLWAPKPSSMFSAIKAAQDAAGAQIAVGGTLRVTFTHEEPNKTNPRLNPAKQYSAVYVPPNAFAEPAQAAPAQPSQPVAPGQQSMPADHAMAPAQPAAADLTPAQPVQDVTPAVAPANPAETAKDLLRAGLSVNEVATATGLPSTTVQALANLVAAA